MTRVFSLNKMFSLRFSPTVWILESKNNKIGLKDVLRIAPFEHGGDLCQLFTQEHLVVLVKSVGKYISPISIASGLERKEATKQ